MAALEELLREFQAAQRDRRFRRTLAEYLRQYAGRPTPLYFAERLTKRLRGARIYLKREDLLHTGAHKINNTLGQALLAVRMHKPRLIAETGAGQHGVATATVAALFGLECVIYMGVKDMARQALNVARMQLLGAEVRPVTSGSQTLKDACNEAIRDWVTNVRATHYIIGSVVGPHPYPWMVREFQAVIGREVRRQLAAVPRRGPLYLVACVGGGSNALGLFAPFARDRRTQLIGVEAAGTGLQLGHHAATLVRGRIGVLHGTKSLVLQHSDGQIAEAHSIAPGLDYPGVGPEHAYYQHVHRARYVAVNDRQALAGFQLLAETEGILPALEPAHAMYYLTRLIPRVPTRATVVVCLSGRGDKDVDVVARRLLSARARHPRTVTRDP